MKSVCLSISQSVSHSESQPVCHSDSQSVCRSVCQSVSQSLRQTVSLSVNKSVRSSVHQSAGLSSINIIPLPLLHWVQDSVTQHSFLPACQLMSCWYQSPVYKIQHRTSWLNWQRTSSTLTLSTTQVNNTDLISSTDDPQSTWLWWWLLLRLSKRQSMSSQKQPFPGLQTQNFGFINWLDKVNWPP